VKRIPFFHGPNNERLELFLEYAEDYNTGTLPHEKFYDMDAFDAKAAADRGKGSGGASSSSSSSSGAFSLLDDAERRRADAAEAARRREAETIAFLRANMGADQVAAMKRQAELQQKMQYAFRAGDVREAERIKKLLEPEDMRGK
jgi:hypothetical protein